MQVLCEEKVEGLNTDFRAALLDGIQKAGAGGSSGRWIHSIVTRTHGVELTRLKSLIDDGGDIRASAMWWCVGSGSYVF